MYYYLRIEVQKKRSKKSTTPARCQILNPEAPACKSRVINTLWVTEHSVNRIVFWRTLNRDADTFHSIWNALRSQWRSFFIGTHYLLNWFIFHTILTESVPLEMWGGKWNCYQFTYTSTLYTWLHVTCRTVDALLSILQT